MNRDGLFATGTKVFYGRALYDNSTDCGTLERAGRA